MDRGRSKKFLLHSQESPYHIGFVLTITTGFRLGEVLGLRWQDVDFDNHTVTSNQTLGNDNKLKSSAKTNSSKRTIPIPNETVEELRKHKIKINKDKLRLGSAYRDLDLINCNDFGEIVKRNTFRENLVKVITRADVKKLNSMI